MRKTYRKQNVRRLKRTRGASGAGRSAYSLLVEKEHKAFALYKFKRNVHVSGESSLSRPVETGIRYFCKYFVYKSVALFRNGIEPVDFRRRNFKCLCKADYIRYVLRSRALAGLLPAAFDEITDSHSASYIKQTDALRSVELVSRCGQHINAELVDVYRHIADSLNGVRKAKNALFVTYLRNLRNRHYRSDFVVCIHYCNERRVRSYCLFNVRGRYSALGIDVEISDLKALFFKLLAGVKCRVMLNL